MRANWKQLALRSIGFVILAVLLFRMDFRQLGQVFVRMSPGYLAAALGVNFLAISVKAFRWQYLLRAYGRRDRLGRVMEANFAGYFLGLISPGQAGEFAKIALLPDSSPSLLPSVLADRLMDVAPLVLVGLAGGILYLQFPAWTLLAAAGLAALPAGLFLFFKKHPPRFPEGPAPGRFRSIVLKTARACAPLLSLRLDALMALVLVVQVFNFAYVILLALALGLNVPPVNLIFFISLLSLSRILPISIMGVGTRDALSVFLFGSIGVAREQALSFSISILLVDVFYLAAGFLVYQRLAGRVSREKGNGQPTDGSAGSGIPR